MGDDAASTADAALSKTSFGDACDITDASRSREDDPKIALAEPRLKKPKVEQRVSVPAGVVDENDSVNARALHEKHDREAGTCMGLAPHAVAAVSSNVGAAHSEQHAASVTSDTSGDNARASDDNVKDTCSSVASEDTKDRTVLARGEDTFADEEHAASVTRTTDRENAPAACGEDADDAPDARGKDADDAPGARGKDAEHSAVRNGRDERHVSADSSTSEHRDASDVASADTVETDHPLVDTPIRSFFSAFPNGHEVLAEILNAHGMDGDGSPSTLVSMLRRLAHGSLEDEVIPPKVFETFDMDGVADKINRCSNIIVMVGAGLSTSAGIPDFRTPGTGLYDNLAQYNLPEPESLFTLEYFRSNPAPFYDFCQQLWPDRKNYKPTFAHYFVTLLEKKGKLLRCYSQNIDSLEELAGLSEEKLVAAHGNFSKCRGIDSQTEVPTDEVKEAVMQQKWKELVERHGELVKPDIVFFGEELPTRFRDLAEEDFPKCDLLFVLGTSLVVAPFNHLISFTELDCPRVLVNREEAGTCPLSLRDAFRFNDAERNYRDVFLQGDLNGQIRELCTKLEWLPELESLLEEHQSVG